MTKNVWAVIPAHNESRQIGQIVQEVKKYVNIVLVVDDGSTDTTSRIAKSSGVKVVKHIVNLGKGAAAKTGCDIAVNEGAEQIILMDADGQHEPKDIPRLLRALEDVDVVFAFRRLNKNMPLILRFGNWFINATTHCLYRIRLKDTQCGYRALNAQVYKKVRWSATDYSMESEMIANIGKWKLRYRQVPVETIYEDRYKGTTVFDGIKVVMRLIGWRLFK